MLASRECGGCAAKASAEVVAALLHSMEGASEALDSLVGRADADDAAVMRLDDERALITTVDACPPMVDDAQTFGAIVAANAIGDVLAMGGRLISALAILAIPRGTKPDVGAQILRGAREVIEECGGGLVGGHTVHAPGILFGLSVTGMVHPDRIWRTAGAQPGDALILSRPIGVGVAISHGGDSAKSVIEQLRRPALAEAASLASLGADVHAATDVTGFGLVGHVLDLTDHAVGVELDLGAVPVVDHARELFAAGHRTSAHQGNQDWATARVEAHLTDEEWALLVDPQTTGGLLAAVSPDRIPPGFTVIGQFHARETQHSPVVVSTSMRGSRASHVHTAGAA